MRILAIRGENLASLAARFHLDLGDGPLGSTGIFAITGETGAGKSTILDALCLALYGQYPRVSTGRREDVPDPSGQHLGSGDGRAILRRGAGSGFAEVDFLAQDNIAYRANWTAYRARGRANGRLQNETRSLVRISDETTVATGKTAVSDAVERLTDLTFDQFRRTVVLAQGEFDAFLLATEAERADLLEKITGTSIYSEISRRVHAGLVEQQGAFASLETRRSSISRLEVEARAALVDEGSAIERDLPILAAEHTELTARLEHARRLSTAEVRLAEAEVQAAGAERMLEQASSDAERLAALDAVEPLRSLAAEVARAEAEHGAAAELLERANSDAQAAEDSFAVATAVEAVARVEDCAREAEFATFLPVWSEAAGLDAAILDRTRDVATAQARTAEAQRVLAAAAGSRAGLASAHEGVLTAHASVADRMKAEAAHAELADRADDIAGLFAKRNALASEDAEAARSLSTAQAQIAAADAAASDARTRLAQARETRAKHVALRAEQAAAHAALCLDATEVRLARVQELLDLVARVRAVFETWSRTTVDFDRATKVRSEADASRHLAVTRREAAEAAQGRAERARAEIVSLADLAEGSASPQAAHLRSLLVPDKPCPVCGAHHHSHRPGAAGSDQDGLERLAEAMRERRGSFEAELADAGRTIAAARGDEAAALARLEAADREAEAARSRLAECAATYAELRSGLSAASETADLAARETEELPATLDVGSLQWFDAVDALAGSTRDALQERITRGRSLSRQIDACNQAVAESDEEVARAEQTIAAEAGPRQEAALAAERAGTQRRVLSERVTSLARELTPYLAAAGLPATNLEENAAFCANHLAALGADYGQLRDSFRRLDGEKRESGENLQRAAEAEAVARRAWELEDRTARERAAALAEARTSRGALLHGEATPLHRGRITQAREAARNKLHAAVASTSSLQASLASCRATLDHARTQLSRAGVAHAEAGTRFRTACADRQPEVVAALLAEEPETRETLRTHQDGLIRERDAALTTLATRRADLAALRALPAVDVTATETAAGEIAARLDAHRHRRGIIDAALARDDADGRDVDALAAELAARRESLEAWKEVDAAVGSTSGDRFRRFVQGVTLEHLVQLANVQLRSLSPRYALARSESAELSLHVIDRDMGDELRGMRSLSGGERFLVALALALALSGLEGRQSFVDILFIDEGFGSLDAETLDTAVDALETLQGHGRKVGVITHVAAMIDRIAVQVRVEKRGNGRSTVRIVDGALPLAS